MMLLLALHARANKEPKRGSSIFGKRKLWRERIKCHNELMQMYFNEHPIFLESFFRWRFRMSIALFKRIAKEVAKYDRFF
jgi:hypothetical protein